MRTLSSCSIHDHQACSHAGHRHLSGPGVRARAQDLPALTRRDRLQLMLLAAVVGSALSYCLGFNLGESPAEAKARVAAHDKAVIQATEAVGARVSVCLSEERGPLPDWASEPRIPLFDIDRSFRHVD